MLDLSVINQEQSCQCLVYHGDVSEVSFLLGYDAVSLGTRFLAF